MTVNTAWSVREPTVIVSLLESKQKEAHAAACEAVAEGEELPEAPAAIASPVDAAMQLLEDAQVKEAASGASPSEDFAAVCAQLGSPSPHPALVKALEKSMETAALSVRGWHCDLVSLTALLTVLNAHAGKISTASFWQCALDKSALDLLERGLPPSIETLAVDGSPLGELSGGLAALPSLSSLSLRCASLATVPQPVTDALVANATLTALSLYGNPLGDAGAIDLLTALQAHPALLSLNLGRTGLTDASAQAVLDIVSDPAVEEGAAEEAEEDAGVPAEEPMGLSVAILPNRTLTAINLSYNQIGTSGRLALEAAQVASPGLARLELVGNPCLTCGPTASLSATDRAALRSTWAALGDIDGGVEAFGKQLCAAALAEVAEARPLVGFVPAEVAADADAADAAETKATADVAALAAELGEWEGLGPLSALVNATIGRLVGELDSPETLQATLRAELGVVCASRGLPAGAPFAMFGDKLLEALGTALGDGLSAEAASAWRDAYADASRCMQQAYTPQQLAAAEAAEAAAAAEANEADEGA